jgi:hypothetical protein
MSNKSAATLLKVVETHNAGDVMNFITRKKALDRVRNSVSRISVDSAKKDENPAVVVIDSKMTPLEASTLLWECNV